MLKNQSRKDNAVSSDWVGVQAKPLFTSLYIYSTFIYHNGTNISSAATAHGLQI